MGLFRRKGKHRQSKINGVPVKGKVPMKKIKKLKPKGK